MAEQIAVRFNVGVTTCSVLRKHPEYVQFKTTGPRGKLLIISLVAELALLPHSFRTPPKCDSGRVGVARIALVVIISGASHFCESRGHT